MLLPSSFFVDFDVIRVVQTTGDQGRVDFLREVDLAFRLNLFNRTSSLLLFERQFSDKPLMLVGC